MYGLPEEILNNTGTHYIVKGWNDFSHGITYEYLWFAINPLRFIRQRHVGHVGGKHTPNTRAANDILWLAFLRHGYHDACSIRKRGSGHLQSASHALVTP